MAWTARRTIGTRRCGVHGEEQTVRLSGRSASHHERNRLIRRHASAITQQDLERGRGRPALAMEHRAGWDAAFPRPRACVSDCPRGSRRDRVAGSPSCQRPKGAEWSWSLPSGLALGSRRHPGDRDRTLGGRDLPGTTAPVRSAASPPATAAHARRDFQCDPTRERRHPGDPAAELFRTQRYATAVCYRF